MKTGSKLWTAVVVLAFTLLVNAAVGAGWWGIPTNREISEKYPTPLTPAGWAFAIWGFIFPCQAIGMAWLALPFGNKQAKAQVVDTGANWLSIGWICECLWQLAFCFESFGVSTAILAVGYVAFAVGGWKITKHCSGWDGAFVGNVTVVNAAWLTAAFSINTLLPAIKSGASQASLVPQAKVCVYLAAAVALVFVASGRSSYGFTIVWACAAISSAQMEHDPAIGQLTYYAAIALAAVSALGLFASLVLGIWRIKYSTRAATGLQGETRLLLL